MRKKLVVLGMVTALAATTTACGSNKYVTLGDYTDLEVKYTTASTEVTDEQVESTIETNLSSYAYESEDKKYKAQEGDTVNIDYEGLKDGVAFVADMTAFGFYSMVISNLNRIILRRVFLGNSSVRNFITFIRL